MAFKDAMSWHLPGVIMRGMREPTNRDVDVIDCTDYCEVSGLCGRRGMLWVWMSLSVLTTARWVAVREGGMRWV